jgi:hypothetical protein
MSLDIAKSFAGFANGLKSWLNNKERWNHVYNNSPKALACWLEDLQQANKFNNAVRTFYSTTAMLNFVNLRDCQRQPTILGRVVCDF